MSSLFNYQTLKTRLDKTTRTLFITLNNDHNENCFSMEMLFELESLLAWCTSRVEIHSILIQSSTQYFSHGYNKTLLKKLTLDKLQKFTKKLQKINQSLTYLPQTIIVDLQMGTKNIASEFALACDIRVANRSCRVQFDHAALGIIPCSGGIASLSQIVGHANAKNWLLTGEEIPPSKLESSGMVYTSYTMETRDETIQEILQHIRKQSPVQRIQTKLGLTESVRTSMENMLTFENQIAKAAMITEDWKESDMEESMPAKSMKEAIKLSLVKDDSPPKQ